MDGKNKLETFTSQIVCCVIPPLLVVFFCFCFFYCCTPAPRMSITALRGNSFHPRGQAEAVDACCTVCSVSDEM